MKEFKLMTFGTLLIFVFLVIGGIVAFVRGGKLVRVFGWVMLLPILSIAFLFLAMTLPVIGRATADANHRPVKVAYQPPANWTIVENGNAIAVAGSSVATTQKSVDTAEKSGKLWADDFAKFVNENPECHWLLAQSPEPCVSAEEAMQSALNQAAAQLAAQFPSGATPVWRFWPASRISMPGEEPLATKILPHLESSGVIRDRFVQKFGRPYGDVWRASLLIDASPKKILDLDHAINAVFSNEMRSWSAMIFSTLGLLAAIIGVYYLMDAITKGYFKTRLRIVCVSLGIIGVFLLLFAWSS
jgi:hypothetical protein